MQPKGSSNLALSSLKYFLIPYMSDGLKVVYQHQLEASKPVLAAPETSPFLKALAWVKII